MDPPARSGFSPEQIAALTAPLDRTNVSYREQGRSTVPYLKSWLVIAEANRIFGFDGWQRQTISLSCVNQSERTIGREQKPGWGVTYTARVRVTVTAGGLPSLVREGSGAGHGIDVDLGQAHESALKEAETDAMKRALMTFGNPFGLPLYDRQQRWVEGHPAPPDGRAPSGRAAAERSAAPSRAAAPPPPSRQQKERPSESAEYSLKPDNVLMTRAQNLLKKAGLTNYGVRQLTRALANHFGLPETENFSELSTEAISALVDKGIDPEKVANYNGDEASF